MALPKEISYTKDHEWIKVEDDRAYIGITNFAQEELGDIVFVELPSVGDTFEQGETLCTIESVKAVAEVYAAISGEVVEVNEVLEDEPEKVNEDPFNAHLVVLKITKQEEIEVFMNADEYQAYLEEV